MEILRRELKLKEFTIRSLADTLECDPSLVHAWITGKFSPSIKYRRKLKRLGFSDTALLEPSKQVEA